MNKTIKVALCISLVGVGVFVWPHVATADKSKAPVVVTFIFGDVSAAPQALVPGPSSTYVGPFTASIDFAKRLAAGDGTQSQAWKDALNLLQARNPITYESLSIDVNSGGPLYSRFDFLVHINGDKYVVTMNAFQQSEPTESTPTLNIYHWHYGRFAIHKNGKLLGTGGTVGAASVDFSMTK
jgi:hypothetical protein